MDTCILIALTEDMKKQFKEYCVRHDITMSQKVRHMIAELLKEE